MFVNGSAKPLLHVISFWYQRNAVIDACCKDFVVQNVSKVFLCYRLQCSFDIFIKVPKVSL